MLYHYFRLVEDFSTCFITGDKIVINNTECVVNSVEKGVIEVLSDKESKSYCIDDLYDNYFCKDGIHYLPY